MTTQKIENLPLKDVKPYKKNPRDNSAAIEVVAASIKEFGFNVPIVIDAKGEIIAGHTRYAAAKVLKLKTVPVIRATHLSPVQVRAFRVIDNRASEFADWKNKELNSELAFLQEEGLVLTPLGFDEDELARISKMAAQAEALPAAIAAAESGNGNAVEQDDDAEDERVSKMVLKTAKSVRVKIGNFQFHVPVADYEAWEASIRKANKYDDARVIAALAKKLGLVYDGQPGKNTGVHEAGATASPAKRKRTPRT